MLSSAELGSSLSNSYKSGSILGKLAALQRREEAEAVE
jgi:hypothetical protein